MNLVWYRLENGDYVKLLLSDSHVGVTRISVDTPEGLGTVISHANQFAEDEQAIEDIRYRITEWFWGMDQ